MPLTVDIEHREIEWLGTVVSQFEANFVADPIRGLRWSQPDPYFEFRRTLQVRKGGGQPNPLGEAVVGPAAISVSGFPVQPNPIAG